jgi:hypothetical protein
MDFFCAWQVFQGMAVLEVFVNLNASYPSTVLRLEAPSRGLVWSNVFLETACYWIAAHQTLQSL